MIGLLYQSVYKKAILPFEKKNLLHRIRKSSKNSLFPTVFAALPVYSFYFILIKLALAGGTVKVPFFSTASPLLEYKTSLPSRSSILQLTSLSEGFRAITIVSVSPVLL